MARDGSVASVARASDALERHGARRGVGAQVATGALLVMLQFPLAAAVAHNVAASLLLAALVQVVLRLRAVS